MDFRQRFAGASRGPTFAAIPGLSGRTLPMPDRADTLPSLADKMDQFREVIQEGRSLAVATGLKATARNTTDPVDFAKAEMSVSELEQYEYWIGGGRLQDFDKHTCREPVAKWKGNDTSLLKWLAGLQEMYDDTTLDKEHVVWFASNASFMVPCIMAFTKILSARRALTVKGSDLSSEELAEYQTARKLLSEAAFRVQELKRVINGYTSRIDKAEQAVLTRIRFYEPRIKTKPAGEAPLNRDRVRMGLPRLQGPSNLQTLGKRRRVASREEVMGDRPAARRKAASPEYRPSSPRMSYDEDDVAMGDTTGADPLA